MSFFLIAVNIYFAMVTWQMSKLAFNDERNFFGWCCIFLSALNAASAASSIF